jgi:hypothetical protein
MLRRPPGHRGVATARDILEIVAILAAGIWALYVFVYEQRLKPAGEPPSVVFTGSLHRLGTHGALNQFGLRGNVLNNGQTDVSIIAIGFTADGLRYAALSKPFVDHSINSAAVYQRDARVASRAIVFRLVELTRLAEPKDGGGFILHPGQDVPYSATFAVKKGEFDAITLYGSLAYSKFYVVGGYPTKIDRTPTGAVLFNSTNNNPDYGSMEVTLDEASLW